jgi:hypothetical protein
MNSFAVSWNGLHVVEIDLVAAAEIDHGIDPDLRRSGLDLREARYACCGRRF